MEFRIAMILTVLRAFESDNLNSKLICSNIDFKTAMQIAAVLRQHSFSIFKQMMKRNNLNGINGQKLEFYEKLPSEFNRETAMKIAEQLKIKKKAAERYLKIFVDKQLLLKPKHNLYHKKDF